MCMCVWACTCAGVHPCTKRRTSYHISCDSFLRVFVWCMKKCGILWTGANFTLLFSTKIIYSLLLEVVLCTQKWVVYAFICQLLSNHIWKNHLFNNFEDDINLQEFNGLHVGRILYSTNAHINIVNCEGKEMRKWLVKEIIGSESRLSIN